MIRKLVRVITVASAISLGGCSASDDSPTRPPVPDLSAATTAISSAVVTILGAQVITNGAVLVVPPGALPIGTEVSVSVWSSGSETHYEVDLGAPATFLPAILTIQAPQGVQASLFARNAGTWTLMGTSLTGVFTRPLSASASFKTDLDEIY